MSRYQELNPPEEFQRLLDDSDLVAPQLFITEALLLSMGQHARTLELDGLRWYDGLYEVRPTSPMTIVIDAQAEDTLSVKPDIKINKAAGEWPTKLYLQTHPNFSEKDAVRKRANQKLTAGLWLSVLIGNSLNTGEASQILDTLEKQPTLTPWRVAGAVAADLAIDVCVDIVHPGATSALGVILCSNTLIPYFTWQHARNTRPKTMDEKLRRHFGQRATQLAKRHPALRLGFADAITA